MPQISRKCTWSACHWSLHSTCSCAVHSTCSCAVKFPWQVETLGPRSNWALVKGASPNSCCPSGSMWQEFPEAWPQEVRSLISDSWAANPMLRPSAAKVGEKIYHKCGLPSCIQICISAARCSHAYMYLRHSDEAQPPQLVCLILWKERWYVTLPTSCSGWTLLPSYLLFVPLLANSKQSALHEYLVNMKRCCRLQND